MKVTAAIAALTPAAMLFCWSGVAQAYRPFDGTDASVAETGDVEIELGPAEYLRDGPERELISPDLRVNFGFTPGWEATIQGDLTHALTADVPATSLVGNTASLKTVLREGSLQQRPGPSVATELDLLLPGIGDEPGTGFSLTGIVSQQWDWATVHVNAAAGLTQEQHADYFLDTIIEGPHDWAVRPVAEISDELDIGQYQTRSCLIGRSGKSKTVSRSTSRYAARAPMTTPPARSAPA